MTVCCNILWGILCTCTAYVHAKILCRKGKQTCFWLHLIFPGGHLHIREGHPEHRLKGKHEGRGCVFTDVCVCNVCVRVCKSSVVHSAGNSCMQDFLFCTGNKMAENGRPGTMLWKSASTQVREQDAYESEGRKVSRTRPSSAAGITCRNTFPPLKFKEVSFHCIFHIWKYTHIIAVFHVGYLQTICSTLHNM